MRVGRRYVAERTLGFTESVIREMTRLSDLHGAINLAQGFPDFAAPEEIKDAAVAAIRADVNQYAITWGARALREALAVAYRERYEMRVDPDTMVTVTCGATEAMIASLLAVVDPDDEVIVFEPFYENYGPDATLCGARPVFVPLRPPEFTFDRDELAAAFSSRTKAIVVKPELTGAIRKVHDFLTVGAPAPLQQACAAALRLGRPYYERLAAEYRARRDRLHAALVAGGFNPRLPEGAYYLLCDIAHLGFADDVAFARWLVEKVRVAGVPGSAFFSRPELGRGLIRFTFCKRADTLDAAAERLADAARVARSA